MKKKKLLDANDEVLTLIRAKNLWTFNMVLNRVKLNRNQLSDKLKLFRELGLIKKEKSKRTTPKEKIYYGFRFQEDKYAELINHGVIQ